MYSFYWPNNIVELNILFMLHTQPCAVTCLNLGHKDLWKINDGLHHLYIKEQ